MKRWIPVSVFWLLLSTPSARSDDAIELARVDGEPVTSDELESQFSQRHSGHTMFLLGDSEIRRFLDQVIDERLLVQEAHRLEIDRNPEIVAALEDFRSRKAAELLVRNEVDSQVTVTEEDIRAVWETQLGEVRDLLEIVVASEAEARTAAKRLADGEDFETVARELSIARSKIHGGRVPPAGWGARDPEWERVALGLEPGATSAPFRSEEGWTILRLLEAREVERPELDKVQDRIRALLAKRRLEARRTEFRAQLWSKYDARLVSVIEVTPAAIAELRTSAPETLLATWNGGGLAVSELADGPELEQIEARADATEFLGNLLERTVTGALAALEAHERGLDRLPEIESKVSEAREVLMLGKLFTDHLLRGLTVSDDEVRAWYEGHRDELSVPERRRTAQIVLATREEAEEVRRRLAAGEDFTRLAEELSKDTSSARQGGDLGWVSVGDIPKEMAAIAELPLGGVSEPLETRFGWHLIRVTEIEPSRPRAFEEVAAGLRERLFESKKSERRQEWIAQLRAATEIVVDDAAIAELAKRSAAEAQKAPAGH